jgi:hypothetical protein
VHPTQQGDQFPRNTAFLRVHTQVSGVSEELSIF